MNITDWFIFLWYVLRFFTYGPLVDIIIKPIFFTKKEHPWSTGNGAGIAMGLMDIAKFLVLCGQFVIASIIGIVYLVLYFTR